MFKIYCNLHFSEKGRQQYEDFPKLKLLDAQTYALTALGWLSGQDDLLGNFLGFTGSNLESIKENVEEAGYLVSVLDFLMMDDRWVLNCCASTGLDPTEMRLARLALPGGAEVHWT